MAFFLEKMSSFGQFFDSQMAIFRRVRFTHLPGTEEDGECCGGLMLLNKPRGLSQVNCSSQQTFLSLHNTNTSQQCWNIWHHKSLGFLVSIIYSQYMWQYAKIYLYIRSQWVIQYNPLNMKFKTKSMYIMATFFKQWLHQN